jgi:GT2 family glycosyltransferase
VVVATVGRAARLAPFVDAVLSDPATRELIVVVDGPDDESLNALRALARGRSKLRPVGLGHRGQLAALDEGVRLATGEVVVLLDDDVIPAPGTIGGHLTHHQGSVGLVVVGTMPVAVTGVGQGAGTRLYASEYLAHLAAIERGEAGVLDRLWTGNISLRRDDCRRVGLASPFLSAHYHADRDLGYRLAAAGLVGVYDPTLIAAHLHARSDGDFLRDAERQGAGRVQLHRSNAARLGPFRLSQLVEDLPVPMQLAVGVIGSTPAARPAGLGLMRLGRLLDAAVPHLDASLHSAKLARRIMQWHGARRALGARGVTPASPDGKDWARRPL